MASQSEEFARIAKAERQLCDEAGPVFAATIRAIAARAGLHITEVRVTLDPDNSADGVSAANCTIVQAHDAAASSAQDIQVVIRTTQAGSSGLSATPE
jgi:hypothetical protein